MQRIQHAQAAYTCSMNTQRYQINKQVEKEERGSSIRNKSIVSLSRGYEDVTEQESSSSGCFLLVGCSGFLGTEDSCRYPYESSLEL